MDFLLGVIGEFFKGLFDGLNQWLAGRQAHSDAVSLGAEKVATDQAVAGEKVAAAETAAAVNAPKDVAGVEKELSDGTF